MSFFDENIMEKHGNCPDMMDSGWQIIKFVPNCWQKSSPDERVMGLGGWAETGMV